MNRRTTLAPGKLLRHPWPAVVLSLLCLGSAPVNIPTYSEHQDLLYYLDENGARKPIKTPADWEIRKKHVRANVQKVMGVVPGRSRRVPLDVKVIEEVRVGTLRRQKITYQAEADGRVPAYLFLPAAAKPGPAILCLHQTTKIGKGEPAGLGGNANLHYALHLARRGYVTLAPDYPSFGEHTWDFAPGRGYVSGSMKAVWDNKRALDLLQALPEVDGARIGCIGHSLGGHNAMFTAAFDERIKVIVSSCGFTRFHKDDVPSWTGKSYMPLIASVYKNDPDRVPFDFTEIVGTFAPRPFLACAAVHDHDFDVSGVRDTMTAAKKVYDLYGKGECLQAYYPNSKHDFPEDARSFAYRFLDQHLKDPAPDWIRVTEKAGWQPRDSSGEVVFKDRLWLLGGWFNSFAAPPRDVWSSADGKTWQLVAREAPWKHSDLPMTVAFKERMWLMGGWFNGRLPGHGASSEVWSSTDGVKWEQTTKKAGWSPRLAAGAVVFKGRMWILGGTENYYFGDDKSLKNDVWSSADGKEWKQETRSAPWSPRAYHAAVVHDGKIWVCGGGNYVPKYHALNDVWCSADGVNWEQVTKNAAWHPRIWFSAVVYRDHLWVMGGWSNNPSKNWGDVWYSRDGKQWAQLKSKTIWKERHEHSAYVFQDKIWVAAGHAQPLSSEVWSLEVPRDWFRDSKDDK